jgi:hypothetical protein
LQLWNELCGREDLRRRELLQHAVGCFEALHHDDDHKHDNEHLLPAGRQRLGEEDAFYGSERISCPRVHHDYDDHDRDFERFFIHFDFR